MLSRRPSSYAEDALGQEILRLRREKENLLDTIWLATSPHQIRQLWQKVVELLGDEQTILQKEALAIGATESPRGRLRVRVASDQRN